MTQTFIERLESGADFVDWQSRELMLEAARHVRATVDAWMPIETAPDEHGTSALLWFPGFPGNEVQLGRWSRLGDYDGVGVMGSWSDLTTGDAFETPTGEEYPTHWMPLPAAPSSNPAGGAG